MGMKVIVGPINKGLRNDRLPFVIDNDSFPSLINAYQWRGRIKRKRGTSFLGRLTRFFNSTSTSYSSTSTIALVAGAANILTGFSLQINGNIVPGSISINDVTAPQTYTDPSMNGTLSGSLGGTGTINYATGAITITGGGADSINASFLYFPDFPVLGLEDLNLNATQFPGTLAFDTTYSYNIQTVVPYSIYDVSFYKNPTSGTYPGYTEKTNVTPTTWNGQDYQQFWTANYQGALWATNGTNVPFSISNIGMQFKVVTNVTMIVAGPPATARLTIIGHGLVVGDFLFLNEIGGIIGINFQTCYVTNVFDPNNVDIELPNATLGGAFSSNGIAQYLTNRSDPTKDCLRWYDGDPTDGNPTSPTLNGHKGWVNFAPPLSQAAFSIADNTAQQYYLVGAKMIVPFKDRLLFLGPVIQSSSSGSQIYLQDTVIYSQNGTPYYTASFTGSVTASTTVYTPILVPGGETATANAYFEDSTGFGGFITAGFAQPILTASPNEDVLIIGFSNRQTRFVYTGNDIVPFNFFVINSELGSGSTFSIINMDRGVMSIGDHGIIITAQIASQRIDLEIPDQVFQFNLTNNGSLRITAQRDFINEWIYFTYPDNEVPYKFPNQTLQYNYRDDSWGIFNECYTTYGQFRKVTGYTWATIGTIYPTWSSWNTPWNAGSSSLLQPKIIAGNQQGFILERDDGTDEGNSLYIQSFSGNQITAPDHCLNDGDYIVISGCIGTISSIVNGNIYSVYNTTTNTFRVNPSIGSGTYSGGGLIKRMYIPFIETKQFPVSWEMARKTRIGPQQYLLSNTDNGQITLLIYLSENAIGPKVSAYNIGPIIPSAGSLNNTLIYSTILYTCPESTNLGLTAANTNLQMPTALDQNQIWHRVNTSLIGDTVQVAFTMSDDQMRDTTFSNQFSEIELHGLIINVSPSQVLA